MNDNLPAPEEAEEQLSGGNMNRVARVGNTVRRDTGPWTPRVHMLLTHLHAKGIQEVPLPLGFDRQGREILSFIPGQVGHAAGPELLTESVLRSAGRLLRRLHDASTDVASAWSDGWRAQTREPIEVICHGDFAPYNCVFDQGSLTGVIDFDYAHPGSRAWDLAYALYRFAPITAPSNPDHFGSIEDQCRRARLFCDAYDLQDRSQVVMAVKLRIASMADFLRSGAAQDNPHILANIAAGHLDIYLNDYAHLDAHFAEYVHALG
jgi:hypothetical protein